MLRSTSGARIRFPNRLLIPLSNPCTQMPCPLSSVLGRSPLSLQLAHTTASSALLARTAAPGTQRPRSVLCSKTAENLDLSSNSHGADTGPGPPAGCNSPLVVCPDETGAVDGQDAVPDGEPAVGGRGAVLDEGTDVDPRRAERSVLLAGKGSK